MWHLVELMKQTQNKGQIYEEKDPSGCGWAIFLGVLRLRATRFAQDDSFCGGYE